jgi:hypothetical protein
MAKSFYPIFPSTCPEMIFFMYFIISRYVMQEVRWDGGGTELAHEYKFWYRKGNGNHELGTWFKPLPTT